MPAAQSQLRDSLNLTHDFQFCSLHFGLSSHSPPGSVAPALRPCGLASLRPCVLAALRPCGLAALRGTGLRHSLAADLCGRRVRALRRRWLRLWSLRCRSWFGRRTLRRRRWLRCLAQLSSEPPLPRRTCPPLARCPGCGASDSVGGWSCGCCGAGADHGPHIRAVVLDPCTSALRAAATRKYTPRAWT
jgi:hypothetical protein